MVVDKWTEADTLQEAVDNTMDELSDAMYMNDYNLVRIWDGSDAKQEEVNDERQQQRFS